MLNYLKVNKISLVQNPDIRKIPNSFFFSDYEQNSIFIQNFKQ